MTEEKEKIAARLKAYEDKFYADNGRPVSSREDLLPEKESYKRYQKLREKINQMNKHQIL